MKSYDIIFFSDLQRYEQITEIHDVLPFCLIYHRMYQSLYQGYFSFLSDSINNNSYCCFGLNFDPSEKYIEKLWANLGLFTGCLMLTLTIMIASSRIVTWKPLAYKG